MSSRGLTPAERALAASIFGVAIDYDAVRVFRRKWWPLQPERITMAPDGHLWFHPLASHYCDDFCAASLNMQAHFLHEMTHVWQAQTKGRWYLTLMRHPWCRYSYTVVPGRAFRDYGLEQQAEIVRHLFLARAGRPDANAPPVDALEALVPFTSA